MTTAPVNQLPVSSEPKRRLSLWRVLLALLLVAGIGAASTLGTQRWLADRSVTARTPWFASYVDVTATPQFAFEKLGLTDSPDVVLSFIVSHSSDPCTPSWGSAYTLSQAGASLDLDRRIARLRQQGGNVAVSFGGLKNKELATACIDETKLRAAYRTVIDRYDADMIDLDIEGPNLANTEAGERRATVIAKLQSERRAKGKNLAVWLTLPVTPLGLAETGTTAVSQFLDKGVDLAGVNIMTMDYGLSLPKGQTMLEGSKSALNEAHRQLGVLYQRAGINLTGSTLWAKLGATPMIGQNDVTEEVFSLADAKGFNQYARSHGLNRMSMWSANRDLACGGNYVDLKTVSDSCSGVAQDKQAFTLLLSDGFKGNIALNAGVVTKADPVSEASQQPDNSATSPYQIWSATGAYLQGTKVVWRHNVYESKWWTQGDMPDNPVLQAWETPWQLIGPVLPGEKPVPQATLPAGTYPEWSGTNVYDTGQRVLFKGNPYQAKWWNRGESPAAASSNADNSPWVPLTQSQVNAILAEKKAK